MSLLIGFIDRQFISKPPIPTESFAGKTVIVTGANTGLGLEACRWIVRLGASQVIIACRDVQKGEKAAKDIQSSTSCSPNTLQVWHLDMSSFASVQAFSERAKTQLPRLDALIANAGRWNTKFELVEDNEETLNTNVVSLALLGFLIHPMLRATASKFNTQTHFTVTGSELYEVAKFKERKAKMGELFATLNDRNKANMGDRYNVSKLLVMFVIKQMATMAPLESSGVIVNCVAPGFCASELGRDYASNPAARLFVRGFARPTEVGARTLVYGASAGPETHGQYLPDCKIKETAGLTKGKAGIELQDRVWSELRMKLEAVREGVTHLSSPT